MGVVEFARNKYHSRQRQLRHRHLVRAELRQREDRGFALAGTDHGSVLFVRGARGVELLALGTPCRAIALEDLIVLDLQIQSRLRELALDRLETWELPPIGTRFKFCRPASGFPAGRPTGLIKP